MRTETEKAEVQITTTSGRVIRYADIVYLQPTSGAAIVYVRDASGFTEMHPVFITREAFAEAGLRQGC
jgi:hypothetical protein